MSRIGKKPIPTDRKMRNIRLTDEEFKSVYSYVSRLRNGQSNSIERNNREHLKAINVMFQKISDKMVIGSNYNHNEFSNDLLDIWNYVRKQLKMDARMGF